MKEINRQDLPEDYKEWMHLESHHDHRIVKDDLGVLRWEKRTLIRKLVDKCDFNSLIILLNNIGIGKNSEEMRYMYRCMGYSLSGYWEIFHWEVNNPKTFEYNQPEPTTER